jgi:hypothetical protein
LGKSGKSGVEEENSFKRVHSKRVRSKGQQEGKAKTNQDPKSRTERGRRKKKMLFKTRSTDSLKKMGGLKMAGLLGAAAVPFPLRSFPLQKISPPPIPKQNISATGQIPPNPSLSFPSDHLPHKSHSITNQLINAMHPQITRLLVRKL